MTLTFRSFTPSHHLHFSQMCLKCIKTNRHKTPPSRKDWLAILAEMFARIKNLSLIQNLPETECRTFWVLNSTYYAHTNSDLEHYLVWIESQLGHRKAILYPRSAVRFV